ncbi:MAG: hypothetical protein AAGH40_12295, partial [Verrucomicrobiota bacterium]
LEYYIVDWGDEAEPDLSAFEGIDAMLSYYSENSDSMKIAYENTKKLNALRKAYLEANPPKQRDTIINFRPIE